MSRAAAAIALAALFAAATPAAAGDVAYLYVDASEGGGSGGHAALVLADQVFHFEHRAPGLLHLAREPFETVRRRYGLVDNRTIELTRIAASDETQALIADEFTRRYLVQSQHLADQRALVDDRELLEAALAEKTGAMPSATVTIDGAGFFFEVVDPLGPGGADDCVGRGATRAEDEAERHDGPPAAIACPDLGSPRESAALARLRRRVAEAYGDDFARQSSERLRSELSALAPSVRPAPIGPLAPDRMAVGLDLLARQYRDLAQRLAAFDVLRDARPLRARSLLEADEGAPALPPEDVELASQLAAALERSLVRLFGSPRPDRGDPLLLGMARLIALDETVRSSRWVTLDTRPGPEPTVERRRLPDPAVERARAERAERRFRQAVARLRAADTRERVPEVELAELESAAHRRLDVVRAGRADRATMEPRTGPADRATLRVRLPSATADELRRAGDAARDRAAAHAEALRRLYDYGLVRRNCVTELFRTIAAAFARDIASTEPGLDGAALAERVAAVSTERLGGYVDPDGGLLFIPAASEVIVRERYAVAGTTRIPSYRRAALASMYATESALPAFLRESNTITSTVYRRAPEDSTFLFFTDDVVATRPLFGALNVLAGLGAAVVGLATAPVDRGDALVAGLKGIVWSLPELAFFNIRKGTFADAPWKGSAAPPAEGSVTPP